jgi:carbamoyltransferase
MAGIIIGISAYYHDSAACILRDGQILAAAQEERFTRKKHDSAFPSHALSYVLSELDEDVSQVSHIAFYDKPLLKFERLIETYHAFAPRGLASFFQAIPVWLREKMMIRRNIREELKRFGLEDTPVLFPEHHLSHAASAFYPSPFRESAILTVDGVGEWATTTIGHGTEKGIRILREINFPHSLGLLYSAFTYYCGFRVNSGEYKLMGLAPFGRNGSDQVRIYRELITGHLIDIRDDGSFILNMRYFDYATGLRMTSNKNWEKLFGVPPRKPESSIDQVYCDMALAIQQVTEDILLRLAETARHLTGAENLVMAGGVALNSVANGKIERSGLFRDIWIQPAAGDAGGAAGAALAAWHIHSGRPKKIFNGHQDGMSGAFLGPSFSRKAISRVLSKYNAEYEIIDDFEELCSRVAGYLDGGLIVGWFQGRMEFGPRALGNRSILADARNREMQKRLNLQIKFRESFRPFAPAVLSEQSAGYFSTEKHSPYMLIVCPVSESRQKELPPGYGDLPVLEKLYHERSDIPAVTHIDYSARIQTVHRETNPRFHRLIEHFNKLTGYPVLINTSFNVRGEPIVCTPEDAFICFMRTDMDILVMEDFILEKPRQENTGEFTKFNMLDSLD